MVKIEQAGDHGRRQVHNTPYIQSKIWWYKRTYEARLSSFSKNKIYQFYSSEKRVSWPKWPISSVKIRR